MPKPPRNHQHDTARPPCEDGQCLPGQVSECRDLALHCNDLQNFNNGRHAGQRSRLAPCREPWPMSRKSTPFTKRAVRELEKHRRDEEFVELRRRVVRALG